MCLLCISTAVHIKKDVVTKDDVQTVSKENITADDNDVGLDDLDGRPLSLSYLNLLQEAEAIDVTKVRNTSCFYSHLRMKLLLSFFPLESKTVEKEHDEELCKYLHLMSPQMACPVLAYTMFIPSVSIR